jgi:hypothetical protein
MDSKGLNVIATRTSMRPGMFPLGSIESRAAARALAQTKGRRDEMTPANYRSARYNPGAGISRKKDKLHEKTPEGGRSR